MPLFIVSGMNSRHTVPCKNVFPIAAILAIVGVVMIMSRLLPLRPIRWKDIDLQSPESHSCGMICSANFTSKAAGRWYPTLRKEPLHCHGLITRLGDSVAQTATQRLREVFALGFAWPPPSIRRSLIAFCLLVASLLLTFTKVPHSLPNPRLALWFAGVWGALPQFIHSLEWSLCTWGTISVVCRALVFPLLDQ